MTFILLEKKKARCSVLMVDSAIPCSVPVPLTLRPLWVPSACLSENPVSEMLPGVDSLLNQLNGLCHYSCEESQQDAVGPALHLTP